VHMLRVRGGAPPLNHCVWEWHPPVVTAQNPPEWERLEWQELLAAVAERCYPWDSEDRVGWIPEQLDGGTL
jgi:hypothetical protein